MNRYPHIKEVAEYLDVSLKKLREVAGDGGYLFLIGQSVLMKADELDEMMETCRVRPKAQDCIGATKSKHGLSETATHPTSEQALANVQKLKKPLPNTSGEKMSASLHRLTK